MVRRFGVSYVTGASLTNDIVSFEQLGPDYYQINSNGSFQCFMECSG